MTNSSEKPIEIVPTEPDKLHLYQLAAHTIRGLAMDAVQKAESGHPGMPMGMADAAVVLWSQYLKHNPADSDWPDRDRFVLSAGHGSMLLYSLMHLTGYPGLTLAELKNFRQWESTTPGHPENHLTPGIETTTGPLGQGIGNAVGMALAERWLAARFNQPNFNMVDHYTYVIASDGDLMEGVSHEVCSLAGHLGLGKLIVLYDDNEITIDGPTSLAFSEDVPARFRAYGWHTQAIDGHNSLAVATALAEARVETERPSLIACRTHIGFGSPNKQGTAKAHGEPLGEEEVRLTKTNLGWPADQPFFIPGEALEFMRQAIPDGGAYQAEWQALFQRYEAAHPDLATDFRRAVTGELPDGWADDLVTFAPGKPMATRNSSGAVLEKLVARIPTLLGGSGDLTPSNKTQPKTAVALRRADFSGRYIHFGVREHGMGAILNGIARHGGLRPYGGTFLIFSDYMKPTIRLAAMMGEPVIYVFTHDSIGLGEDGPTHQPIEQLAGLRAIPNLTVFRPADANESAVGWQVALANSHGPTALVLTRQNVPVLEPAVAEKARYGAYVVSDAENPQLILMGTGSEVHIALEAQQLLAQAGLAARVVSMPSWELFEAQSADYRAAVLPPALKHRIAIEAASPLGWERYVGRDGVIIGLNRFGASAPYQVIYEKLGLTAVALVTAARELLHK
jgi:transketolase